VNIPIGDMNIKITKSLIIENMIALFTGNAFSQLILAAALILTARSLGAEKTGQYVACFAIAKLSSFLFEMGMDAWLLKEGGLDSTLFGSLVGSNLIIKSIGGSIWFLVILLVSLILNRETYPTDLLLLISVTTWIESFMLTFTAAFKSILRNKLTATISVFTSVGILIITLVLLRQGVRSPMPFVIGRLLTVSSTLFFCLGWMLRQHKLSSSRNHLIYTLQESRPFFLSNAVNSIYAQADVTIVALFLGRGIAGVFGPVSRVLSALLLVPRSAFGVMVPVLGQLVSSNDNRLIPTIRAYFFAMAIIGGGMWLSVGLFSEPVLPLILGPEFFETGQILKIFGPLLFIKSMNLMLAAIIVTVGWQQMRVQIQAFSAILNTILSLIVVQPFGVTGVAWMRVVTLRWISNNGRLFLTR
jgi:O-antigen/teichoic acid export membrane protein